MVVALQLFLLFAPLNILRSLEIGELILARLQFHLEHVDLLLMVAFHFDDFALLIKPHVLIVLQLLLCLQEFFLDDSQLVR